ncbi:MAG: hypothetical protein C4328_10005, partial [Meiothermus sp.]
WGLLAASTRQSSNSTTERPSSSRPVSLRAQEHCTLARLQAEGEALEGFYLSVMLSQRADLEDTHLKPPLR